MPCCLIFKSSAPSADDCLKWLRNCFIIFVIKSCFARSVCSNTMCGISNFTMLFMVSFALSVMPRNSFMYSWCFSFVNTFTIFLNWQLVRLTFVPFYFQRASLQTVCSRLLPALQLLCRAVLRLCVR
jgi:hypothetical protein